jgi:hypothetical protein
MQDFDRAHLGMDVGETPTLLEVDWQKWESGSGWGWVFYCPPPTLPMADFARLSGAMAHVWSGAEVISKITRDRNNQNIQQPPFLLVRFGSSGYFASLMKKQIPSN